MFRTLIADDEEIIRRGISGLLSKDPEIQVVATAEDGLQALKLSAETIPDLFFVDINMPYLNGLEFIEQIRPAYANAVIIIISGYDEFEYVQKALQLGIFDYMLKPIMEDNFFAILEKAKKQLKKNNLLLNTIEWARIQLRKNRQTLIAEFLSAWLGGHYSESEVQESLKFLEIELPASAGLTLCRFPLEKIQLAESFANLNGLLYFASENNAKTFFRNLSPILTWKNPLSDLVILSDCEPAAVWKQAAAFMKDQLERELSIRPLLVQEKVSDYRQIAIIYESAMTRLNSLQKSPAYLLEIREYIDQNYMDPDISLSSLADRFNFSAQHLSRIFGHESGLTFVDYLTRLRIRKAIELLRNTDLKIYEISVQIGYSNQQYFSSVFKRLLGVSPVEYRRSLFEPGNEASRQDGL